MFLGKTHSGKIFLVRNKEDVDEQIAKQLAHVEDKKAILKDREEKKDEIGAKKAVEQIEVAEALCNSYYEIDDSDPPVLTKYE